MKNLIIGAARSGLAAASYLLKKGEEVLLTDMDEGLGREVDAQFKNFNYSSIWGQQPDISAIQPDRIIISPGVPLDIEPIRKARALEIPIISEAELAFLEADCRFLAITGTNGKTTTTTWLAELMKEEGRTVVAGGNIGTPLISQVAGLGSEDVIVAELSSFQLESVHQFRPQIAAILNVTPDHLDRHKTLEAYLKAKSHIFNAQGPRDALILNGDDPLLKDFAQKAKAHVYYFSRKQKLDEGIYLQEEKIFYRLANMDQARILLKVSDVALPGVHNLENAMAASLMALLAGQSPERVARGLRDFQAIEHRLEPVGCFDGVRYINDSKGTNPDATEKALTAFPGPLVLILGGHGKEVDLSSLAEKVKASGARVILQGAASNEFAAALGQVGGVEVLREKDLERAVVRAKMIAKPGDTVLFSPACSSFDQFSDYEARGRAFKKWVTNYGS